MRQTFKVAIVALGLAAGFGCIAAAGQFEDGMGALSRGEYPTALKLLVPLADKGDERAQAALGRKIGPPPFAPVPWQVFAALAVFVGSLALFGVARYRAIARRSAAGKNFRESLPPDALAEIEGAQRIARERPWKPITFALGSVEMVNDGFRLRGVGTHRGRAFGFSIAFTMAHAFKMIAPVSTMSSNRLSARGTSA